MRIALAALVALSLGGCVSAADKAQISTASATTDGNLRDWDTKMSDTQKKTAYWRLAKCVHSLDHGINGKEMPEAFQAEDPPWIVPLAKPSPAPTTPGVDGSK